MYRTIEDWLGEKEGWGLRIERMPVEARDWVEAAWRLATDAERERCATVALEQRCERGTPWDRACVAIAKVIREG